jgi:hypothetical protein
MEVGRRMIYYIPLRTPIGKALLGTFGASLRSFVKDKPGIGVLFLALAAFVFWTASQQWKAASAPPKGPGEIPS